MNRPCTINFHGDAAPLVEQLPERYQQNVMSVGSGGEAMALSVQNAFLIDFAPEVVRTRVGGGKAEDPIDFPLASISFIEWYYGNEVPDTLVPDPHTPRKN